MSREHNKPFFRSLRFRYGLGLLFFLAVGGYLLWEEHNVHIMENGLIVLLLGACIGMHFFMHGGHGHGDSKTAVDEGEGPANVDKKEVKK